MALNTWELDTLAEIKARALARLPVSAQEKQLVLDLLAREKLPVNAAVIQNAANAGFNVDGIVTE